MHVEFRARIGSDDEAASAAAVRADADSATTTTV
jgi:hypothetical protein